MANFCRTYLDPRSKERLVILDIGSMDVNGSYRELFSSPPWKYIGADLASGKNVDLVLDNSYHWDEIDAGSVDVVVSGQTFEHTEFFWDTMREIARVLKPQGLCCLIAPSAGPEHRYPQDCWRIYPDGFAAVARYAYLEVLEAQTQWNDLPDYDNESNKWHDSLLVARKPRLPFLKGLRLSTYRWMSHNLRPHPAAAETLVQVFPTVDNTHREEGSIIKRVTPGCWADLTINLPDILIGSLRIDFMSELTFVDVAKVSISGSKGIIYYEALDANSLNHIQVSGDAERSSHASFLRVNITGIDPQLFLPALKINTPGESLQLQLRLYVHSVRQKPAFAASAKAVT